MPDLRQAIEDAAAAVAAFVAEAAGTPAEVRLVDDWDALLCDCPVLDLDAALVASQAVVEAGGEVQIGLERLEGTCTLTCSAVDRWVVAGAREAILPRLGASVGGTWTTAQLRQAGAEFEGAEAQLSVDKAPWKARVAREGRSAWIGLSLAGFVEWLATSRVDGVVESLLGADCASAHVRLADWSDAPLTMGKRLRVGSLDDAWEQCVGDDTVLRTRLLATGREAELPAWRAIELEGGGAPDALRRRVAAVAALTAARLVGPAAPAWTPPAKPGSGTEGGQAVLALARWVAADYGEGRLQVARSVALAEVADPLAIGGADAVEARSTIAFSILVDEEVREALAVRARFESAYRDLDDKVAQLRADVAQQADQVIVRALTGTLGVAIAALASGSVRGWPATIAAFVLAGYVLANAAIMRSLARDGLERLAEARELMGARELQLGPPLGERVDRWRAELERRVRRYVVALIALGLLIAAAGVVANEHVTGVRIAAHTTAAPAHAGGACPSASPQRSTLCA